MNLLKNLGMTSTLLAAAISIAPAFAADEHNVGPGLTAVGAPLGLHGVDPVAFIDIGNRIAGSAAFTATYDGVAYYFSSNKNLTAFEKKPKHYAPQNGGFCTFGVSVGKKFDGNPNYSSVVGGKLYVFLNEDIFKLYQKDRAGTITKAAKQWKKVEHIAALEL
ncbi:MAG: YHS domain-containing protein [Pseudomonadales bacterium]|nr:YHS domain-containing protein [Pseudomonadales bacterium]